MTDRYILAGLTGFLVTAVLHVLAVTGVLQVEGRTGILLTIGSVLSSVAVFGSSMLTHPDAVVRPGRVSMPTGAISRTAPAWSVTVGKIVLAYCVVVLPYCGYRAGLGRQPDPPPSALAFVFFAIAAHLFWSSVTVRLGALRRRASLRR